MESFVSAAIVLPDGTYFGNLCAFDRRPAQVDDGKTIAVFEQFAKLVALEIDNQGKTETLAGKLLDEQADGALREQFIAVLGHDLRNPLSSISACAHIIKLKRSDPEMLVGLADRIVTSVRRMTGMIDDLFDLAIVEPLGQRAEARRGC